MPVKPIDPNAVSAVFRQAEQERLQAAAVPGKSLDLGASSIARKDVNPLFENYRPSRPDLKANISSAVCDYLQTLDQIYGLSADLQKTQLAELERLRADLQEVQRQKAEQLQETAKKNEESGVWGVLQAIGSFIIAAISAIAGVFLVTTGVAPVVGGLAIAASLFTIANGAILTPEGFWGWVAKQIAGENEELERFIAVVLPLTLGLLAAGVSLYAVGQLNGQGLDLPRQVLLAIEGAVAIFSGVTTICKGVTDYQVLNSEAKHIRLQAKVELDEHALEKVTTEMGNLMKELSQCGAFAQETIGRFCEILRQSSIPV